jgi:guanylate kinase
MQKTKNTLFLLIGPSAVGKTTLAKALIKSGRCPSVKVIPSYTTRAPRPEEREGIDYYFITQAEFDKKQKEGFFIEYSTAYQNSYGSSKKEVLQALSSGFDVLLVIDRVGVRSILREIPEAYVINIVPTNINVLRERLLKRSAKKPEDIEFRLAKALEELAEEDEEHLAHNTIVNDDLERAVAELVGLICAHKKD